VKCESALIQKKFTMGNILSQVKTIRQVTMNQNRETYKHRNGTLCCAAEETLFLQIP